MAVVLVFRLKCGCCSCMSLSMTIWLIDEVNGGLIAGAVAGIELGAVEDAGAGLVAAVAAAFGTAKPGGGIVPSRAPSPYSECPPAPVARVEPSPNRALNRAGSRWRAFCDSPTTPVVWSEEPLGSVITATCSNAILGLVELANVGKNVLSVGVGSDVKPCKGPCVKRPKLLPPRPDAAGIQQHSGEQHP